MTYFLSRDDPQRQRSSLGLIDCLTPLREHRLDALRVKNFPAPTVRPDFDDCHIHNELFAFAWMPAYTFI